MAKASASVRQAQASLDAAKLDREHSELRAPFGGVVAEVNIDPGDPSASSGQVQVRVAVQLTTDVGTNKVYTGKVSYIAPAATASGNVRIYQVQIALNDPAGLRPGMQVRVIVAA